jgi:hydroxymethylbilane synthase
MSEKIRVGLRDSPLSKKQFEEFLSLLDRQNLFEPIYIRTTGDQDLKASLKEKDKTDFFTREIDEMQLAGTCRLALHSAKDLPDPIPKGLQLIALTKGQSSSDTLVLREGQTLSSLKPGALIGSSSFRRDEIIRKLRADLLPVEIRGTIDLRLEKLLQGEVDGLMIAEAALIRLGKEALNRIPLPIPAAPLQGQLAVIGREGDDEMVKLFTSIDSRYNPEKKMTETILYLGLDPKNFQTSGTLIHYPIIETVSRNFDLPTIRHQFDDIPSYTDLIFTSQTGVNTFFNCLTYHGYTEKDVQDKKILAIGSATRAAIESRGINVSAMPREETQEGIAKYLASKDLRNSYFLIPCSARARSYLSHFFMLKRVRHQLCFLYDTQVRKGEERPNLEEIDTIVFTSPSTVDAFKEIFGKIPKGKKYLSIGPITERRLCEAKVEFF